MGEAAGVLFQNALQGGGKPLPGIVKLHGPVLQKGHRVCKNTLFLHLPEPTSAYIYGVLLALGQADREGAELAAQLHLIRHDDLRGMGGRGGPTVCYIVGNGHIRFMAYGGDDRDAGIENGTGDHFFIKRPQVLHRAAAPAHDEDIGQVIAVCIGNGIGNFPGGLLPLHTDRKKQDLG